MNSSLISGIVLAGGRSKRMGMDKRHLLIGEKSLLSIAIDKLQKVTEEVIVVLAQGETIELEEVLSASDLEKEKGPLIGLLTGLQKMRFSYGLVIPCDLPFIPLNFLRYLRDLAGERSAVVPRWGGRIYPLSGVYTRTLIPQLIAWKNAGDLSLTRFLERSGVSVRWVEEEEILPFGSPARVFLNINTPENLRAAQKRISIAPFQIV